MKLINFLIVVCRVAAMFKVNELKKLFTEEQAMALAAFGTYFQEQIAKHAFLHLPEGQKFEQNLLDSTWKSTAKEKKIDSELLSHPQVKKAYESWLKEYYGKRPDGEKNFEGVNHVSD